MLVHPTFTYQSFIRGQISGHGHSGVMFLLKLVKLKQKNVPCAISS